MVEGRQMSPTMSHGQGLHQCQPFGDGDFVPVSSQMIEEVNEHK